VHHARGVRLIRIAREHNFRGTNSRVCARASVSLSCCCCRWQKFELQLLGGRKVGGVLCGHARTTRLGQEISPLPIRGLIWTGVQQVLRSGGLKKAARGRCVRHRSLVFSRRACLPVTPSRGRGCDLHSARQDVAVSRDVPCVATNVVDGVL
jgi:hypothetical protein